MEVCHICGFTVKSNHGGGLTRHYIQEHGFTRENAIKQIKFLNKNISIPKCPICGDDCSFHGINRYESFNKTCGKQECIHKLSVQSQKEVYIKHPEKREIRRQQRLNYLSKQENRINTAWYKRAKREYSFLEKWFIDNIIIKYELTNKYDIISEKVVNSYFLDFAFDNIKLDVELDGRCHFNHGEDRIQHDINRDQNLNNEGWKVYQISYKDVECDGEKTINDFINYLNNIDILQPKQLDYNEIIDHTKIYKKQQIKRKIDKLNRKIENENKKKEYYQNLFTEWINILKKSDIDFSKFGWKTKVFNLLHCSHRTFNKFKNETTFLTDFNCYVNSNMKGSKGQKWIIDENGNRKRIKI